MSIGVYRKYFDTRPEMSKLKCMSYQMLASSVVTNDDKVNIDGYEVVPGVGKSRYLSRAFLAVFEGHFTYPSRLYYLHCRKIRMTSGYLVLSE